MHSHPINRMDDIVRKLNQIEFQGESMPITGFPNIWKQGQRLYKMKQTKEPFQSGSVVENGSFDWMRRQYMSGTTVAIYDAACDDAGNIWIVGTSGNGKIIAQPETTERTSGQGNTQGFIASYNSSGVLGWVTWVKSPGCLLYGICVNQGQAYICGASYGAVTGILQPDGSNSTSDIPTTAPKSNGTASTGFVLSLTTSGMLNWFRYIEPARPQSIAFKNDMLYICGQASGTTTRVNTNSTDGIQEYTGGNGGFLCCMNTSGFPQWFRGVNSAGLGVVRVGSNFVAVSGYIRYYSGRSQELADISLVPAQSGFSIPINHHKPTTVTISNHVTIFSSFIIIYNLSGTCTEFHWILSPSYLGSFNFTIDTNDIIYATGISNRTELSLKYAQSGSNGSASLAAGPSNTSPRQFLIKYNQDRKTSAWVKWFDNENTNTAQPTTQLQPNVGIALNNNGVYITLDKWSNKNIRLYNAMSSPENPKYVDLIVSTDTGIGRYYAKFDLNGNFKWSTNLKGFMGIDRTILQTTRTDFFVVQSTSSFASSTNAITVTDMDTTYAADNAVAGGSAIAKFGPNWFNFVKTFQNSYKSIESFINADALTGDELRQLLSFIDDNGNRTSAWDSYNAKSSVETLVATANSQLNAQLLTLTNDIKTTFSTVSELQSYSFASATEFAVVAPNIVSAISNYLKNTYFPEYTSIFNKLTENEKNTISSTYKLDASQFTKAIDISASPFLVPPGVEKSIVPIYTSNTSPDSNISVSGVNVNNTGALGFKAFDNKTDTSWESQAFYTAWIKPDYPWISWRSNTAKSIIGYEMDLERFGPADFQLEARNETADAWTILHTRKGYVSPHGATSSTNYTFSQLIKPTAPYKEYRLYITKHQDTAQHFIRIRGLRFMEYTGAVVGGKFPQLASIGSNIKGAIDGVEAIVLARSFKPAYDRCVPLYVSADTLQQNTQNIYTGTGTFGSTEITAAFINLANKLIENYKTAYSRASDFSGFTPLSSAAASAATASPSVTSYVSADTQIDTYVSHFASLVVSLKSAITSIQNTYTSNKTSVAKVPSSMNLNIADYTTYVNSNTIPFRTSSSATVPTKYEQLIDIYEIFQTANSGLQTLVHINSFQQAYEKSRLFILDSDLLETTVVVKNKVYDGSAITMDELTAAFRNVLSVAIGRYWGIQNSSNKLGSFAENGTVPIEDDPTSKDLAALKTLREKYFGTTGLWTVLGTSLSDLVVTTIDTYKETAASASVSVDQVSIDADLVNVDETKVSVLPKGTAVSYGGGGGSWEALGSGVSETAWCIATGSDEAVYVGGSFGIAKWNGTAWTPMGTLSGGSCYTILVGSDGTVYAGGEFTGNVVRWTGTAWAPLGSIGGRVNKLVMDSTGVLYAGGNFTGQVAKWNGSAWAIVGVGLMGNSGSECLALAFASDGTLYAGGSFTAARNNTPMNCVAKWNGTTWSALGDGLDADCNTIAVESDGSVYFGGYFTNHIAKWNGSWSDLGTGLDNNCWSIIVGSDGNVYAGGDFTIAGGVNTSYIAKWNGTAWSSLNSNMNAGCNALAFGSDGALYTAGSFTTPGVYVAKLNLIGQTAPTFLNVLTTIQTKYTNLISGVLSNVRGSAKAAIDAYNSLLSSLSSCNPTLESINTTADATNVSTLTNINSIKAIETKYKQAQADLYNNANDLQIAFIERYIKLYSKYGNFRTNAEITKRVSLLAIPASINSGNASLQSLKGKGGKTNPPKTASSLPTTTDIDRLSKSCTGFREPTGHLSQLVDFIRLQLTAFVRAFDAEWNTLSNEIKANYATYTSPIPTGANEIPTTVTDAELYDLMNQYAGFQRDSLESAAIAAPTVSLTSNYTSAEAQANALELLIDFNTMYNAAQSFLTLKYEDVENAQLNDIRGIINTITAINANVRTNLQVAVDTANAPTFPTARSNFLTLLQKSANVILMEYKAIYDDYIAFREAVSGVGELPTLPTLSAAAPTWTSDSISTLTYTAPGASVYLQSASGSLQLFGSLASWNSIDTHMSFINGFKGLVASIQTAISTFREATKTRIPWSARAIRLAIDDDSMEVVMAISSGMRTRMINIASDAIGLWFMKTFLVDTYYGGRRYLYREDVPDSIQPFVTKCETYLNADGSLKSSPLSYAQGDTLGSLVRSGAEALRAFATALGTRYNATWATWVTGGRLQNYELTKPTFTDQEIQSGSEAVRLGYLTAWGNLITPIIEVTQNSLSKAQQLTQWYTAVGPVTVGLVSTTGMAAQPM